MFFILSSNAISFPNKKKPFFILFWPRHRICRGLVPRPGIGPMPPAVEAQSPNHWTTREVPWEKGIWNRDLKKKKKNHNGTWVLVCSSLQRDRRLPVCKMLWQLLVEKVRLWTWIPWKRQGEISRIYKILSPIRPWENCVLTAIKWIRFFHIGMH